MTIVGLISCWNKEEKMKKRDMPRPGGSIHIYEYERKDIVLYFILYSGGSPNIEVGYLRTACYTSFDGAPLIRMQFLVKSSWHYDCLLIILREWEERRREKEKRRE